MAWRSSMNADSMALGSQEVGFTVRRERVVRREV